MLLILFFISIFLTKSYNIVTSTLKSSFILKTKLYAKAVGSKNDIKVRLLQDSKEGSNYYII